MIMIIISITVSALQFDSFNIRGPIRDFFSFSVWAHFLARANAQKVLFGIFVRALELTLFNTISLNNKMLLLDTCYRTVE